jgi:excisionase family DNA binding protein
VASRFAVATDEGPALRAGPSSGMTERLLTADQVAQLLQVKRSWVYAETRAGRIPHVPLGRYVRYRLDAIEVWIREMEDGVPPAAAGRHRGENAVAQA